MTLAANIAKVKSRLLKTALASNKKPEQIQLLAVSKTRSANTIRQAYGLGLTHFGENYLQEALQKIEETADLDICWHFIGPIQSNKTKDIASAFNWVHSVDRLKIAQRLNTARQGQSLNICLQVNIDNETSKSGCTPEEALILAEQIKPLKNLTLRGLMAIPKVSDNYEDQCQPFKRLKQLLIELQQQHPHIDTLSMGMSADMDAAISEGATIVRIGTDIFGPRVTAKQL